MVRRLDVTAETPKPPRRVVPVPLVVTMSIAQMTRKASGWWFQVASTCLFTKSESTPHAQAKLGGSATGTWPEGIIPHIPEPILQLEGPDGRVQGQSQGRRSSTVRPLV